MKTFKYILFLVAMLAPFGAAAQTEASTFGAKLGYTSKNSSAVFGLFYQYRLQEHLRIAPEMGCVFRHQDLDALTFDVNMHFPMNLGNDKCCLYPLAGLDFSAWSQHDKNLSMEANDDVTLRHSRFGVNLGAGFEYYVSTSLKLNLEWKYTLTSKYSTTVATVGVGYCF